MAINGAAHECLGRDNALVLLLFLLFVLSRKRLFGWAKKRVTNSEGCAPNRQKSVLFILREEKEMRNRKRNERVSREIQNRDAMECLEHEG
jgi:hypothetical protein